MFGELALLDRGPRTATALALTDRELLELDRDDLLLLFQKSPAAALRLLAAMGRHDAQGRRAAAHARVAQRQRGGRGTPQLFSASPTGSPGSAAACRSLLSTASGSSSGSSSTLCRSASRIRSVSVRPADDDRFARGDLPVVLRADQPEPAGGEGPRARPTSSTRSTSRPSSRVAHLHEKTDRIYEAMLERFGTLEKLCAR